MREMTRRACSPFPSMSYLRRDSAHHPEVFVYSIRRRERYMRLSCGKWGLWKTVGYRSTEEAARTRMADLMVGANCEVAIFYKGTRLP